MLLAGTFFVPHAAKIAPRTKASSAPTVASTPAPLVIPPSFDVAMTTTFRLPPSAFEHLITAAAAKYALDAALIRAVINAESAFDPLAVSRTGAMGLMQLMPETARELGVDDPFDVRESADAGVRYLKQLLALYRGNARKAVAAYNAGMSRVPVKGRAQLPPETRSYVNRVFAGL
jgi:soluble lytic murein transglycosylase-like protein